MLLSPIAANVSARLHELVHHKGMLVREIGPVAPCVLVLGIQSLFSNKRKPEHTSTHVGLELVR